MCHNKSTDQFQCAERSMRSKGSSEGKNIQQILTFSVWSSHKAFTRLQKTWNIAHNGPLYTALLCSQVFSVTLQEAQTILREQFSLVHRSDLPQQTTASQYINIMWKILIITYLMVQSVRFIRLTVILVSQTLRTERELCFSALCQTLFKCHANVNMPTLPYSQQALMSIILNDLFGCGHLCYSQQSVNIDTKFTRWV